MTSRNTRHILIDTQQYHMSQQLVHILLVQYTPSEQSPLQHQQDQSPNSEYAKVPIRTVLALRILVLRSCYSPQKSEYY